MRLRTLAAVLVALGTLPASAQKYERAFPRGFSFVLPLHSGPGLLRQCSRSTPENVTEYWEPSARDIEALESELVKYLGLLAVNEGPPRRALFHRQYIGIVREGVKLIYGSFYSDAEEVADNELVRPVIVCDGGAYFWGIVYDPARRLFSELSFNGVA